MDVPPVTPRITVDISHTKRDTEAQAGAHMTINTHANRNRIQARMSKKRREPPGEKINEQQDETSEDSDEVQNALRHDDLYPRKGGNKDKSIKAILAAWWLLPRTLCACFVSNILEAVAAGVAPRNFPCPTYRVARLKPSCERERSY